MIILFEYKKIETTIYLHMIMLIVISYPLIESLRLHMYFWTLKCNQIYWLYELTDKGVGEIGSWKLSWEKPKVQNSLTLKVEIYQKSYWVDMVSTDEGEFWILRNAPFTLWYVVLNENHIHTKKKM